MSKLTESFRAVEVYNPYEFYGEKPYISFSPAQPHSCIVSRWAVHKRGLNLSESWYDHGAQTFSVYGDKQKALLKAQIWATGLFGIKEWTRDPYGSYGDAEYVKSRVKELKQLVKEKNNEVPKQSV